MRRIRAAWLVCVTREAQREMPLHVGPFRGENAEHHRVARRTILSRLMVTEDTVLAGA